MMCGQKTLFSVYSYPIVKQGGKTIY
jgi:hypothetical protein